jgi:heavy metal sensor kinase
MFSSIRYTLLLWQAAILTAAIGLFGTALYAGASHGRMWVVDSELESAARAVVGRLLTPPTTRPIPIGMEPPAPWSQQPHGVPSDWATKVPANFLTRPGLPADAQPYFVVVGADGAVIARSAAAPADVVIALTAPKAAPDARSDRATFRTTSDGREAVVAVPSGGAVLVGRSTAWDRRELGNLRLVLLSAGGIVLVVALAGGWVLATRATAPIRAMGAAARAIAASSDGHLPTPPASNELAPLARTLNDSFDRLRAAYDRQAQFTADASHELRTPLAVIRSQTDLALRRPRSADEYRKSLEACNRAAGRMAELVDSLLLLAAADAGRLELARSPTDLAVVVRDAAALLQPLADDRHVAVELDLHPAILPADSPRLSQVATNLLSNAIRYNRPDGQVRVSVTAPNGRAMLTVVDTGVGIPAEDVPRLFERFHRADAARSRDTGGSGLGLSICQGIVRAHGGTITVDSIPDQGTRVTVELPVANGGHDSVPCDIR